MKVWSEEKQRNVEKNPPERVEMLKARRIMQRGPWSDTVPWHLSHKYIPAGSHKKLGKKSV